jgi:hypothetical protein
MGQDIMSYRVPVFPHMNTENTSQGIKKMFQNLSKNSSSSKELDCKQEIT